MKFLKNKPFQIIFAVFCGFLLAPFLNDFLISLFFSISGFLKELLMWVLPFLIFFCLSSVLSGFDKSAPLLVFLTLLFVILSNGIPLVMGYGVGSFILPIICDNQTIDINNVQSKGYSFFMETIYWINRSGYKIKQIPIVFVDRDKGESKISRIESFRTLKNLFLLITKSKK